MSTLVFSLVLNMNVKYFKILLLLLGLSTGHSTLFATHIIGGEILYECLGNEMYEITMKIYRDCATGQACFDSDPNCPFNAGIGSVSIFRGSTLETTAVLDAPIITEIEAKISNPCLRPPANVCVEEGIYKFRVSLATIDVPYTISYQRCCRNRTILNIQSPGAVGGTYTTTITPLAQQACNSSPEFIDFPPIIICNNEDINFDHSAIDIDGDSLVYSLCTPFVGANTVNPAPERAEPPPYDGVTYIGNFSITNPVLAERPGMRIDAATGLITGIPSLLGQYVVGICVEAYKDGELMNVIQRDFQFNVGECVPLVKADVEETELRVQNDQEIFYIRICGLDGTLVNESTERFNIRNQNWGIDFPLGRVQSNEWNFEDITFPGIGTYDGILILNEGFPCNDTALIQIEVLPDLTPDFSFEYDICEIEPVSFTDRSTSAISPAAITDWIWDFGNMDTIFNEQQFNYQYDTSGNFPVSLTVKDINDCEETITQTVSYFPVPEEILLGALEDRGCEPVAVTFTNLSNLLSREYTIDWDFGDGNTGTGLSPTHLYETPGIYDIAVSIISPDGCTTDTLWEELITILQSPVADFSFSPMIVSNFNPTVDFTDQSQNARNLLWDFNDLGTSEELNPSFNFIQSGLNPVLLEVTSDNGCTDTTLQYVEVLPEIRYTLPNAFTPNGDGTNDTFFGKGNIEDATSFQMTVWNRYGESIFETTDPNQGWNGRKNNEGQLAPNGVYVVVVNFTNFRGEAFTQTGYISLVR